MTDIPFIDDPLSGLFNAAARGNVDGLRDLLAAGINPVATDANGMTPLALAVAGRKERAFAVLLDEPRTAASVNMRLRSWNNGAVLDLAVLSGDRDMVEKLLASGACVNMQNAMGWTALNIAIAEGNQNLVDVLLAAGADVVRVADNSGVTPLAHAAQKSRPQIMRQLLDAGADIAALDKEGNTIAHLAAMCCLNPRPVLEVYIEAGGDLNSRDKAGWSPYDIAEWTGNDLAMIAIRDLLVERGQKPVITPKPLGGFGWGGIA